MPSDDDRWVRAKRVAQMRASGLTLEQIAGELNISVETASNDLQRFYRRLLDFLLLDGTVLGELLHQIDNILVLALSGYSRATRLVFDRSGRSVEEPDHQARRAYLATALDAIREKASILGLTRTDNSLILQVIQNRNEVGSVSMTATQISADNVPEFRKHLRAMREILQAKPIKTLDEIEQRMMLRGVKNPPREEDLPGILLKDKDQSDESDATKSD